MNQSIHAGDRTLRISEGRFEQSPYFDCYADTGANTGMVLGVYAGRFYPKSIGDDPAEGYWALRRTAAMYDVPERPVQIEGPDAVPFMERVFARKVATLREGRGRYAIACTPNGGVFMDGVLFNLSEGKFWYVQPDGALEAWLVAHGEGFDVTVSDPKSRVVQIQGPGSLEIMRAASAGGIDERMGYFHAGYFDLGGQRLYVSRTGWTGELGFEIYGQGAQTDHKRLWDHLIEAGAPHGMVFSGAASMEIRRIEAGILDNGTDMDMSMTPYQAGLGAFIDLDKQDFVGRAALLEADRRSLLYGVKCPAATPRMGCPVLDGGRAVGRVTAGARSPLLECGVGYVRFDEPGGWVGRALSLQTREGETHPCEIVELPFYDKEKRIARGLDKSIPEPP
ncbi:MAG: aminomethyltransferase family protein [Rhodospirillales bacterium]|nr:aminomethyltransferase family protein [Rhodospirillales bacterium]